MYHRGKPSEAHEYNAASGVCIHCNMTRSAVESLSHVCKPHRENLVESQKLEDANRKFPDGCTCKEETGGRIHPGNCDWCRAYYGVREGIHG